LGSAVLDQKFNQVLVAQKTLFPPRHPVERFLRPDTLQSRTVFVGIFVDSP
jgi:hypothetical protein